MRSQTRLVRKWTGLVCVHVRITYPNSVISRMTRPTAAPTMDPWRCNEKNRRLDVAGLPAMHFNRRLAMNRQTTAPDSHTIDRRKVIKGAGGVAASVLGAGALA